MQGQHGLTTQKDSLRHNTGTEYTLPLTVLKDACVLKPHAMTQFEWDECVENRALLWYTKKSVYLIIDWKAYVPVAENVSVSQNISISAGTWLTCSRLRSVQLSI